VLAVLLARDNLQLGNVQAIGTRADYTLVDIAGAPAGVIEFSGTSTSYTSEPVNSRSDKTE